MLAEEKLVGVSCRHSKKNFRKNLWRSRREKVGYVPFESRYI